ncbi:uracil-DNA glycosylase [Candidatus Fokinia crypta]|uniref:Type-4 uracil-DNA glycosylase n=1 Tax=Candidatus Fokinia crypta TaxID=1920990 RepID=A0ABZ0UUV2_9RICK|nr:uracil-DNA glycosylase [Candidatus Fokinia cryptica]WPX97865.1 Uracil DNA glycosylase superfamily protein [Candidatus Fokinia cryptica]
MANNILLTKAMLASICIQLHKIANNAINTNFRFFELEYGEKMSDIISSFQKLRAMNHEKVEGVVNNPKVPVSSDMIKGEISKKVEDIAPVSKNKDNVNNEIRELLKEISTVEELRDIVMKFEGCKLKSGANNTVFADGEPSSSIMIVGEAPGENEDKYGIPFCGESGALLEHIFKSMGLQRKDIYITNAIFYRPPSNRKPTSEEIDICRPFVQKHIAIVKPKLLLLMGATAAESVLHYKGALTPIHGKVIRYGKMHNDYIADNDMQLNVVPLFHPSYMLRQALSKKIVWNALLRIKLEILK